jgi:hypothetical protein
LESRVLGVEGVRRFAEQPGDANVIDFGKAGEFVCRNPAVAGFYFRDRGSRNWTKPSVPALNRCAE